MSTESTAPDAPHPTSETTHHVNESADKIRLKTKLKRGNDVRNEDQLTITIKGDDPAATVARLDAVLDNLTDTADTARAIQPGTDQ